MSCFFLLGNRSTPEIYENEGFSPMFRKRNTFKVIGFEMVEIKRLNHMEINWI